MNRPVGIAKLAKTTARVYGQADMARFLSGDAFFEELVRFGSSCLGGQFVALAGQFRAEITSNVRAYRGWCAVPGRRNTRHG